jgi:hypothetical protein
MATDSFDGEEESVARGWGGGGPAYAESAGRLSVTVDALLARSKHTNIEGVI